MEKCEDNYCKEDKCDYSSGKCAADKCETECYDECEGKCYGSGDEMTEEFMRLGDEAFGELLKEKIKAHMEKEQGKKLDAAAKAIYDACHLFYARKMKPDMEMEAAFDKIRKAMAME